MSVLLVGSIVAGGCFWGPALKDHTPATSGRGLATVVDFKPQEGQDPLPIVTGELLTVDADGMVLLTESEPCLLFVPFAAIRTASFPEDKKLSIGRWGVNEKRLRRMRLQSRFPQGVSNEVETELLDFCKMETIPVVPER